MKIFRKISNAASDHAHMRINNIRFKIPWRFDDQVEQTIKFKSVRTTIKVCKNINLFLFGFTKQSVGIERDIRPWAKFCSIAP